MPDDKILYVSTDLGTWESVQEAFGREFAFTFADNAEEALKILGRDTFSVVISGLNLPGMGGMEFLAAARQKQPSMVRIVLTGSGSMEIAVEAVNNLHVYAFLTIPCPMEEVGRELRSAAARFTRERAEGDHAKETLYGAVKMLVDILEMVTPEAMGRSSRIRSRVRHVSRELGLKSIRLMDMAALLSHIGCVGLPGSLLGKLEKDEELTKVEKKLYRSHPSIAAHLLANVPRMGKIAEIIRHQNTPSRAEPPMGARVLRACIYLDVMENKGREAAAVLEHMASNPDKFDADVVAALGNHAGECRIGEHRQVTVPELEPGMVMASDMVTRSGAKLLLKGQAVSEASCMRLQAFFDLLEVTEPICVEPVRAG